VHLADKLVNVVGLSVTVPRIISPVVLFRGALDIGREIDKILTDGIIHIEESFLPLPA
jgi:hypothetical protein